MMPTITLSEEENRESGDPPAPCWRTIYPELAAQFPNAQVVRLNKVYRFKAKPLMRWLADHVDLNALCVAAQTDGGFSMAEYMQFYQDIGYSLSGFVEVFADHMEAGPTEEAAIIDEEFNRKD